MITAASPAAAALLERVAQRGLRHVALGCVDWDGRLRAKHYAAASLAQVLAGGVAMTTAVYAQDPAEQPILCGPFADPTGGYPDGRLVFDAASARDAPYDSDGDGILLLGQFDPPYAGYCPRALAAGEIARWQALGYTIVGGYELEFRLLDEDSRSLAAKSACDLHLSAGFERMYSVVGQAATATFLQDFAALSARMAAPLHTMHHEFAGLIEAALTVATGLDIAEHAIVARTSAAIAAQRAGKLACFMARVSATTHSAGAHLNLSLQCGAGRPSFAADDAALAAPMRACLGGLQRYLPELFVLCAPTINSYKRFAPDCLAPRSNSWGIDNKTVAYRAVIATPAETRIEVRVPGADSNPYLALAAVLAAARAGLEQSLTPTAACAGDADAAGAPAAARFPRDLAAAVAAWRASAYAAKTFGADFVEAYARSRDWQLQQFAAAVTDWELQTYARSL